MYTEGLYYNFLSSGVIILLVTVYFPSSFLWLMVDVQYIFDSLHNELLAFSYVTFVAPPSFSYSFVNACERCWMLLVWLQLFTAFQPSLALKNIPWVKRFMKFQAVIIDAAEVTPADSTQDWKRGISIDTSITSIVHLTTKMCLLITVLMKVCSLYYSVQQHYGDINETAKLSCNINQWLHYVWIVSDLSH